MTTITPVRSREQRLAALAKANAVRVARARLKLDIKDGDTWLVSRHIALPYPWVESMRVTELLDALPGVGPARVHAILRRARVNPCKTLGGLTQRQRDAILDQLERRP